VFIVRSEKYAGCRSSAVRSDEPEDIVASVRKQVKKAGKKGESID
jgi:hypothetical protein